MSGIWQRINDWACELLFGLANNSLTLVKNPGPGTYEHKVFVGGNGDPYPWHRTFYNATGGKEEQISNNENFINDPANGLTCVNIFSQAAQTSVNANIDSCGLNLDTNTGQAAFWARNADGTVAWGGLEVYNYPTTLGSQTRLQSKPMTGDKRDDIIADSGGDATNPCLLRVGGSLHRISIDANGFLKG